MGAGTKSPLLLLAGCVLCGGGTFSQEKNHHPVLCPYTFWQLLLKKNNFSLIQFQNYSTLLKYYLLVCSYMEQIMPAIYMEQIMPASLSTFSCSMH